MIIVSVDCIPIHNRTRGERRRDEEGEEG